MFCDGQNLSEYQRLPTMNKEPMNVTDNVEQTVKVLILWRVITVYVKMIK